MYFFIDQKKELVAKLNEVFSENDLCLADEIMYNTNIELYKKYDMPAVFFDEDGYSKGEASDEELSALADRVKADGWKDCYYNDENDESLFKSLDREFISIFSENVEKEINKRLN